MGADSAKIPCGGILAMYDDLHEHLKSHFLKLRGDWVRARTGYEPDICDILGATEDKRRYWDAWWNTYRLELKKGTHIWLDLVRYSEVLLHSNDDASQEVLSLFFIPGKQNVSIDEIICVETATLLTELNLNETYAEMLVRLNQIVPRNLNAQANLTVNDLRRIQIFSVPDDLFRVALRNTRRNV